MQAVRALENDCSTRYLEQRALRARVAQLEENAKAGRNEKL